MEAEAEWQIIESMKRRAGTAGSQLIGIDGEVVVHEGPERPQKSPISGDFSATWAKVPTKTKLIFSNTQTNHWIVTREDQAEGSDASLCKMAQ